MISIVASLLRLLSSGQERMHHIQPKNPSTLDAQIYESSRDEL
jgi:hypothetical protein